MKDVGQEVQAAVPPPVERLPLPLWARLWIPLIRFARSVPCLHSLTFLLILPSCPHPCSKYLRRPVVVTIGTAGKATDNVTQRVVVSAWAAWLRLDAVPGRHRALRKLRGW